MLIDFHVHAFPDRLAESAVTRLAGAGGFPGYTNGTVADTQAKLASWGVDLGVVLNIAVSPRTQKSVNDFAISVNGTPGLLAFGSVHPDSPDALAELDRLKDAGIPGIKLHPAYQGFSFDDPKAYPVYARCGELGLPLLVHAGWDVAFPDELRSEPEQCAAVLRDFPGTRFILAHLGGMKRWDDAYRLFCGKDVYLDLAFVEHYITPDEARRIIFGHDPDRLLFGSDCPWNTSQSTLAFLNGLGVEGELLNRIAWKNAAGLLGL